MTRRPIVSHSIEMQVPFYDLDPMQIVWHGNYLKYFDRARAALFSHINVDLYDIYNETEYLFPIIRSSVKHITPLMYNDRILCTAHLMQVDYKIVFDFELRRLKDDRVCAKGRSEQVAIRNMDGEMLFRIPGSVRERILNAGEVS